jgi:hypothetical protein
MSERKDTPVTVDELRQAASGQFGYADTEWHLHLLSLAADEIERLSQQQTEPDHSHEGETPILVAILCPTCGQEIPAVNQTGGL